ncbi:WG repeat-containing protein, partial [Salinimicrobium oceani]
PVFDNATDFYGNYANIIKDSIFGFVDLNGNHKLFPEYEQVYWYYSDTGFAKNNDKFALIERNGRLITDFIFDKIDLPNEGYFPVEINGKWNHVDSEGNFVFKENILLNWDQINDSLVVILDSERTESNKNPKQGIMNIFGNIILQPIYQDVTPV